MKLKKNKALIGIFSFLAFATFLSMIIIAQENETNNLNETMNLTNETLANQTILQNQTNVTTQTNITTNITTNVTTQTEIIVTNAQNIAANLYIKPPYPKGPDFVFVCNITGFTPNKYTWFYGDGHKLLGIANAVTYHVYETLGNYTVNCSGTDGVNTASDSLDITVTSLVRPTTALPNQFGQLNVTNATTNCAYIASQLSGIPVQNGDVCDVIVVRQSPQIIGRDEMVLNKFTLMNSVFEFSPVPVSSNGSVYVMGDFALLESELNGVLELVVDYMWTATGIHTHMMLETPKTTFLHWEAKGDIDTLISQIRTILATRTSIYGNVSNATATAATETITSQTNETSNRTTATNNTTNTTTTTIAFYQLTLAGTNEVSPNNSTGTGQANVTLSGNTLTITGSFQNLSSMLHDVSGSSVHIHSGPSGTNGPIIVFIPVTPSADSMSGTFSLTTLLTDDEVADLLAGDYYINVHSANFPSGELRGQIA